MKYSQEEILKALHMIKEICEESCSCQNCCFAVHGECQIMNKDGEENAPIDWNLKDIDDMWSPFNN